MRLMSGEIHADDGEVRQLRQPHRRPVAGSAQGPRRHGVRRRAAGPGRARRRPGALPPPAPRRRRHRHGRAGRACRRGSRPGNGWQLEQRVEAGDQQARPARGRRVRGAVGRHEAPRAAGAGAGRRARPAAARRADQPPRHRIDRLAGGVPARISPAAWCSSPTTAPSCATSPRGSSRSIAAR